MKGVVFLGNRQLEVRDFPVPEPGHGEVLIKIIASGICGSDLHVYRGVHVPGQIAGHEPAGIVVAVGPGVCRVRVGDRVSVHHHEGCGVCQHCARGETVACSTHHLCYGVNRPGSFAEYMAAAEANCIPIPESASCEDGAFMACVGATAYAALRRLEVTPHESLAVFGLGPVGLSCVVVGKAMGLRVIGSDVSPARLEIARACGADSVVDARSEDPVDAIRQFSTITGYPWQDGIDYVIETSGSTADRRGGIHGEGHQPQRHPRQSRDRDRLRGVPAGLELGLLTVHRRDRPELRARGHAPIQPRPGRGGPARGG